MTVPPSAGWVYDYSIAQQHFVAQEVFIRSTQIIRNAAGEMKPVIMASLT